MLREGHNGFARATHKDRQDEAKLPERLLRAASLYRPVSKKDELTNFYVQYLKNPVRESFSQQVRQSIEQYMGNIPVARQIVMEIGSSERAQWQERLPTGKTPSNVKNKRASSKTVMKIPATSITSDKECHPKGPSPATDNSSIISVAMCLGTILCLEQEATSPRELMGVANELGERPLTGDE